MGTKELTVIIDKAKPVDASILTEIAFAAKRAWKYPERYFEIWEKELTISPGYIHKNIVFVARSQDTVVGFYSIAHNPDDRFFGEVFMKKGFWMEHIFVSPDYQQMGVGSKLVKHVKSTCRIKGIQKLQIFVDPFARGYYEKIGAVYSYNSKSSIPGRSIPVYELWP